MWIYQVLTFDITVKYYNSYVGMSLGVLTTLISHNNSLMLTRIYISIDKSQIYIYIPK